MVGATAGLRGVKLPVRWRHESAKSNHVQPEAMRRQAVHSRDADSCEGRARHAGGRCDRCVDSRGFPRASQGGDEFPVVVWLRIGNATNPALQAWFDPRLAGIVQPNKRLTNTAENAIQVLWVRPAKFFCKTAVGRGISCVSVSDQYRKRSPGMFPAVLVTGNRLGSHRCFSTNTHGCGGMGFISPFASFSW